MSAEPAPFPTALFADHAQATLPEELTAELQSLLDTAARGNGVTATLITPDGTWSGATGFATDDRPMRPDDQMAIASITKTLVAAQVMQLVETGRLHLDDLVADRLPPEVSFDANGARIVDLLSMRSGYPETLDDQATWASLWSDPLRTWTTSEVLGTIATDRDPVGDAFEYRGANYLLLGLIIEHSTGRPLAEVLRSGVLAGDSYDRLIFQPDELPTEPMAMPGNANPRTLNDVGGHLPTLAAATALYADGNMASDAPTLARWFRALCAAEIVSSASLSEMTDFDQRPEYGLGIIDRTGEYGNDSDALGHTGAMPGYTTVALCFPHHGIVTVVLANDKHDVDALADDLVRAVKT